jgi:hypothetical protein
MKSIETTFTNTAAALKSTSDMTASIGSMLGEELAGILMETQNSLTSVQASARLIDDTLGIISRIPLIGARYAPDVPLATSIERVNTSLDPLPDTLSDVQTNLVNTSEDIARLEGDLEALSTHIQDLNTQLKDAHAVLSDYQAITLETQAGLAGLEENTPNMVQAFIWAFGAFLLWLLLSQLGLLLLGLHMLRKGELVTN